jgi:hypothetical protein
MTEPVLSRPSSRSPSPSGATPEPSRWQRSHRFDARALPLADRHYNRRKVGSPQFVPPGRCVVLLTEGADALWVTSWPFAAFVRHAWPGAWVCSCFRNESAHLSSELITEAVAVTRFLFGEPPALGIVTFVNREKTRRKRDPGRCYRKAGLAPRRRDERRPRRAATAPRRDAHRSRPDRRARLGGRMTTPLPTAADSTPPRGSATGEDTTLTVERPWWATLRAKLAKSSWQPDRAHVESLVNALDEAESAASSLRAEVARLTGELAEVKDDAQRGWSASFDNAHLLTDATREVARLTEERDAAVRWIGVVRDELVNAGFPSGDRTVALASIRALLRERDEARGAADRMRGELEAAEQHVRILRCQLNGEANNV